MMRKSAYILLVVLSAVVGGQMFRDVMTENSGVTPVQADVAVSRNSRTTAEEFSLDPDVSKRVQEILGKDEIDPAASEITSPVMDPEVPHEQRNSRGSIAGRNSSDQLSHKSQEAEGNFDLTQKKDDREPHARQSELDHGFHASAEVNTPVEDPPPVTAEAAVEEDSAKLDAHPGESFQRLAARSAEPSEARTRVIRQQTPLHSQMVTPGNFEYLGAFRTPVQDASGEKFSYGGWAVTWRTESTEVSREDELPGSLFIVGHRHQQLVAEISIPRPVISSRKRLDDLPVARVLQPLQDISGGTLARMSGDSSEPFEIGGLQVFKDRLHWTTFKYYNVEGHDYLSHGVSSTDLARPRPQGLWHLGPANSGDPKWHSYKHAGYVCEIPEPFASRYLGGRNMMSGLQICTGLTYSSQGPALFAYRLPESPVRGGLSLNALPMLWYSMQRTVASHHYADRWTGAAWVSVGNKQTILIAGRKAHGPVHYGPARPGDCYEDKGYHGSSYEAQILFYPPGDLVAATSRAVADIQPWYRWDSSTPGGGLNRFMFSECGKDIGGMTYDRKRNLLYIVETNAGKLSSNEWEVLPAIHVLRLTR